MLSNLQHQDNLESESKFRGTLIDEYNIYVSCCDNGKGISIITGDPLLTFEEWLNPE